MPEFADAGAVVYGVSRDTIWSHQKFVNKYDLNMPLLSDTNGVICEAYGVLKEKNMYGKISLGIERTTFILDEGGTIRAIFPKVKVEGHAQAVLAAVREL